MKIPKSLEAMKKLLAKKQLQLKELKADVKELKESIRFYSQPHVKEGLSYLNDPTVKNIVKIVKFGASFVKK